MRQTFTRQRAPQPAVRFFAFLFLLLAASWSQAQAPAISAFAPVKGQVGATVTITGSNFNNSAASNIVFFGSTQATVSAASASSLTVTVPQGANPLGFITVTNLANGLTGYSASMFRVMSALAGDPSFTRQDIASGGALQMAVACGDIDGDGKPDLVVSNSFGLTISVFRNTSTGGAVSFAPKVDMAAATPFSLNLVDLNGDGKLDLVLGTNNEANTNATIYRNTSSVGAISFAPRQDVFIFKYGTNSTTIADLNGDGKPELIATNFDLGGIAVFPNTSTGGTISFGTPQTFITGNQPQSVVAGDLDGDGKPDLAVSNRVTNDVSIFRNTSTAAISFAAKQTILAGSAPAKIAIADLDLDGKLDLALTYFNNTIVSLFPNSSVPGNINFGTAVTLTTADAESIAIGDLDGDDRPDLVLGLYQSMKLALYSNTSTPGTISFTKKSELSSLASSPWAVINDLDGDNKPDLAVANWGNNASFSVFRNITVPDVAPVADLPNLPAITLACSGSVTIIPTATDAIDGRVGATTTDPLTYNTPGTYTIHWKYSDTKGNSSTQDQSVVVNAVSAPVLTGADCAGATLTATLANSNADLLTWKRDGVVVRTDAGQVLGVTAAGGNGIVGTANNQLGRTYGVTLDSHGNMIISDQGNGRIIKWTPGDASGVVVAGGNGNGSGAGQFLNSYKTFVDANDTLYVADQGNHRIQKWAPGATVGVTVAGGIGAGAALANLNSPRDVFVDGAGTMYITESGNNRVTKWVRGATAGVIVAGGNGSGSAANQLGSPVGMFMDASGAMYIVEQTQSKVKKWLPGAATGVTVAGGNGSGSAANQLSSPQYCTVDASGNVYVADAGNNRVQKWAPGASNGVTVAGGNGAGAGADQLNFPTCLVFDASGNLYVSELANSRVQKFGTGAVVSNPASLTNAAAGVYTVTAELKTCSTVSNSITVKPIPTVTVDGGNSRAVCSRTPLAPIGFSSSVNNTVFNWTRDNTETVSGIPASGTGSISGMLINDAAGPITVTFTVTPVADGCTGTPVPVTVVVNPLPNLSAIYGANLFCSGQNTSLRAESVDASANYRWYDAATGGNQIFTGATFVTPILTASTTYGVDAISNDGCVSISRWPVAVTVNPLPPAPVITTANPRTCAGGNVMLTASTATPGAVINWYGENGNFLGTGAGFTTGALSATTGFYAAAIKFCSSERVPVTVTVEQLPTVDFVGSLTYCNNSATAPVTFTGNVAGAKYSWTNSNTGIGLAASGTGNIPVFTARNLTATDQTATITVTPSNGTDALAYIPNYGANTVSVVNTATNTNLATIPVGTLPYGVAISPDGSKVYVSNYGSNNISVIDPVTRTVINTISVDAVPKGMVVSPDGTRLYVSHRESNNVVVVNTVDYSIVARVNLGMWYSEGVVISPDGKFVYVVNGNNRVFVINTTTNTIATSIPIGYDGHGIAISKDGSTIYVPTYYPTNLLHVINTVTNTVTANIPVGNQAWGVAVNSDNSRVYLANFNGHDVSVVDAVNKTVITSVPVGGNLYSLQVSADNSQVFVLSSFSRMFVLNTATNTLQNTQGIQVGSGPFALGRFLADAIPGCTGTPKTFTITVKPTPAVTASLTSQAICSGSSISPVSFTGAVAGTVYNWTRNNTAAVTGIPASGSGSISGSLVNLTGAPVTVLFTVTPTANGCSGTPINISVVVNPIPATSITAVGPTSVCPAGTVALHANTGGSGYSYQWYRNGNLQPALATQDVNVTATGSYTAKASLNGCVSPASNAINVVIQDITPPTITTPANIEVFATSAAGATVFYVTPVGADNCSVTSTVLSSGLASGQVFPIGTTVVRYTVTDGAGLTATAAFTVTVKGLAPVIACPANIVVNNTPGQCGATVSFEATEATAIPASTITYSIAPGSYFPVGTSTVTATATNAVGASSCSFTVTVTDAELPVIACQDNIEVTATSVNGAAVAYTAPVGSDNCASTTTRTAGLASGAVFPIGTTTVTHTVTDASGLTASCSFTVTVKGLAPVIVCPANITVNNAPGQCGAIVNFAAAETTALPASTITYSIAPGSFFPVGTTTVTATATNAIGVASCSFTVTVTDTEAPVITARKTSYDLRNGAVVISADSLVSVSDNCGVATITLSRSNFSCADIGAAQTVTVTATDIHGNSTAKTISVTINGTLPQSFTLTATPVDGVLYTGAPATNLYIGYGAKSERLDIVLPSGVIPGDRYAISQVSGPTGGTLVVDRTNTFATFTPQTAGYYVFSATITTASGCTSSQTIAICVTDVRDPSSTTTSKGNPNKVMITKKAGGKAVTISVDGNAVPAQLQGGAVLGSSTQAPCTGTATNAIVSLSKTATEEAVAGELTVTVAPNPSSIEFTLTLSGRSSLPVMMRVVDNSGRVVDARSNLVANSTIKVGAQYLSGTYFAEFTQGSSRKVVQLMKIK